MSAENGQGQISPDGMWRWTGHTWEANQPALAAVPPAGYVPASANPYGAAQSYAYPAAQVNGYPAAQAEDYGAAQAYGYPTPQAYGYPAAQPYYAAGVRSGVDDTFAWLLAVWPLVYLVGFFVSPLVTLVGLALQITFAVLDVRRIRAAGVPISMWPAVLWVPRHLFVRTRRLGRNYAIPIVWAASIIISVALRL